jgi:hypothetical protein
MKASTADTPVDSINTVNPAADHGLMLTPEETKHSATDAFVSMSPKKICRAHHA